MENVGQKWGLTSKILMGLLLGIALGIFLNLMNHPFLQEFLVEGILEVVGKLFINAIKMLVVPLVLVSLIGGVMGIGDLKKLGRVGGKALLFYLVTTALAITVALLLGRLFSPGLGLELETSTPFAAKAPPLFTQIITDLLPQNPFKALSTGNMLQVIVFAILTGVAISSLKGQVERVAELISQSNEIMMKMVHFVMLAAPIGVFALVAKVFAEQGFQVFLPLLKYMGTVVVALLVHLLFVYSGFLRLVGKLSPLIFFKKFYSAMLVAFSTASSNATIPVTMEVVENRMGVSSRVASFTIPFGATINMDGTAIMQGVAVIFISQIYQIPLSLGDYLMVILTATLATVGTAGVPGVGLITLSMVLTQVKLPVEGVALIMGVDRLLDMMRTAVNICGDAIVTMVVAKSEGELNEAIFEGAGPS